MMGCSHPTKLRMLRKSHNYVFDYLLDQSCDHFWAAALIDRPASQSMMSPISASLAAAIAAAPPAASALVAAIWQLKVFCASRLRPLNSDTRIDSCAVLWLLLSKFWIMSSVSIRSNGMLSAPSPA